MQNKELLKSSTSLGAALGLFIGVMPSAHAADDDSLLLEPSSPWQMNYADDSCRLVRMFGEGEERVIFYIERTGIGSSFSMLAAGNPLKGNARRNSVYVKFGQDLEAVKLEPVLGNMGDFEPALIFSYARFLPVEEAKGETKARSRKVTPALEQSIKWISFRRPGRDAVVLDTGPMGKPMKAMRKCTGDLLTLWGIDLEKHANIKRLPKPVNNPQKWLASKDYPSEMRRKGQQGIVNFRLSVNAEGMPSDCHIQQSTRPEGFGEVACEKLMKRARFEPAVTKDGEKIASFYRNTIRFQINR